MNHYPGGIGMKCSNCGGSNVEAGISIGQNAETGNIGLKYNKGIFIGVTQMYCDLCLDCGEILRFYIKDRTDRKWNKKPGTIGSK
jgi:hypothetical protein